ncbi:MAG TPA: DUF1499 domain-containing protein [Hydrogenophaga sp.]|uniref:DUF1499 domain-containing protein n=1 Tax=Hydrogenophaga sp. TaxID=1904254 RepID=UPI002C9CEB1A|nr:DUF1499 domain-containing protein [Hydrogenophaga sp.]HMN92420.1 DUF1499 domain-containing protein [Hydrogenophaga sp.]HMP10192.1 DUF1499 domain-containing protein [Hydrogenophaga sp.]
MGLALVVVPILLAVAAGQAGWLQGQVPDDLGVQQGRLKPPSGTRNSVSSQADLYPEHPQQAYAAIEAWPWLEDDRGRAMDRVAKVLATEPGVRVLQRQDDYMRAEAQTRWLGFVDDIEFWADPHARVIHVRSASRIGREDFGTNRQRVLALRARYLSATETTTGH